MALAPRGRAAEKDETRPPARGGWAPAAGTGTSNTIGRRAEKLKRMCRKSTQGRVAALDFAGGLRRSRAGQALERLAERRAGGGIVPLASRPGTIVAALPVAPS